MMKGKKDKVGMMMAVMMGKKPASTKKAAGKTDLADYAKSKKKKKMY